MYSGNGPDYEAAAALREARGLIEKGWVQGHLQSKSHDKILGGLFKGREHVSYCAVGAISKVTTKVAHTTANYDLFLRMKDYLRKAADANNPYTRIYSVESWNDSPGRKKEDVLKAFEDAAVFAENISSISEITSTKIKLEYAKFFTAPIPDATWAEPKPKRVKKLNVMADVKKFVNSLPEPDYEISDETRKAVQDIRA